jgi:GT2 family glycosyltransferase
VSASGSASEVIQATVVLPTLGRPELLRQCLGSLARCTPRADEILVVDSSADTAVEDAVHAFLHVGARVLPYATPGLGNAFNFGIRHAEHDVVLLTNDDCTVDASWVASGFRHISGRKGVLVTGRVSPAGDPATVPSTIDDPVAREYAGAPDFVLFTQCVALRREEVLAFGGFDGRIQPSAEDNDLAYRWLRAGRTIRYEPDFLVWHHDWRTPEQLRRLYVGYGVGQGMVYGKHLRQGDLGVVRHLLRDVGAVMRGLAARFVHASREAPDPRLGLLRGLPVGLARGWRSAGRTVSLR